MVDNSVEMAVFCGVEENRKRSDVVLENTGRSDVGLKQNSCRVTFTKWRFLLRKDIDKADTRFCIQYYK